MGMREPAHNRLTVWSDPVRVDPAATSTVASAAQWRSRKLKGEEVNDADAEDADIRVGSVTGPDSGAVEDAAAGGDAAPAEAAARIDADGEAQPAEDTTDATARETAHGRSMHAHLLLSSKGTGSVAPFGTGENPRTPRGCSESAAGCEAPPPWRGPVGVGTVRARVFRLTADPRQRRGARRDLVGFAPEAAQRRSARDAALSVKSGWWDSRPKPRSGGVPEMPPSPSNRSERGDLAERVGFEPTCRFPDKTLSRRPRYDHFGTSPHHYCTRNSPHRVRQRNVRGYSRGQRTHAGNNQPPRKSRQQSRRREYRTTCIVRTSFGLTKRAGYAGLYDCSMKPPWTVCINRTIHSPVPSWA